MFDIDATLGFHSPSVLGISDLEARFRSPELTEAYEAAGLSEAFISKALRTPSATMWYPSDEILIEAGAVHLLTKARVKYELEQQIEAFRKSAPLKIDEITKAVSAELDGNNLTYTYIFSVHKDEIDWETMSNDTEYADVVICGDPVIKLLVQSGATFSNLYIDKNGTKVGIVKVEKCSPVPPFSS
jgi:hypothetical protein